MEIPFFVCVFADFLLGLWKKEDSRIEKHKKLFSKTFARVLREKTDVHREIDH